MASGGNLFRVLKSDGAARVGRLTLPMHAPIETPAMLLYTHKGSHISVSPDLIAQLPPGAAGVSVDALHFTQDASSENISKHGKGGRGFLGVPAEVPLVATARDGVAFEFTDKRNNDAGTHIRATSGHANVSPKGYMQIIAALQPDMFAALADEVPVTASRRRTRASVDRTSKWLDICLEERSRLGLGMPLLAPVVGGSHPDERQRAARAVGRREGIAGFVLAGFGTGESREELVTCLTECTAELPAALPRLVQGIGAPDAIFAAVAAGVDLFDSSYAHLATASGAALAFPLQSDGGRGPAAGSGAAASLAPGIVDLWDSSNRADRRPLVPDCSCYTCRTHSRAYLHHLLVTRELTGLILLDVHNSSYMLWLLAAIREGITAGTFAVLRETVLTSLQHCRLPVEGGGEVLQSYATPAVGAAVGALTA